MGQDIGVAPYTNILINDELLLPVINYINKNVHFHIAKWPLTSRSKLKWKRVKRAAIIDLSLFYLINLPEIKKKRHQVTIFQSLLADIFNLNSACWLTCMPSKGFIIVPRNL
jgi:hypothetical protein